jgi:chemotaxis protein CheD
VGIGQIQVAEPPARLAVFGIGSCVAVFVHDPQALRAGLAHPLLPGKPPARLPPELRAKYTPAAVIRLVDEVATSAAARRRLVAKLVGGAAMFSSDGQSSADTIGSRNVTAATQALEKLGIPLVASETGGTSGRSLIGDASSGVVEVWGFRSASRIL